MNPHKTYNYLELARGRVFEWTRRLTPSQYAQEFTIGCGTLGRTLTHIMISEWYYVQRLVEADVPSYEQWPIRWEQPPPFADLETAWIKQAIDTKNAIVAVRDWNANIEYQVTEDDGRPWIVTASPADLLTQLVTHEVHHRAQALNMLRSLGVPTSDLDFNALMYARREASS